MVVFWAGAVLPMQAASKSITSVTPRAVEYVLDWDASNPSRDYNLIKGTVAATCTGISSATTLRVRLSLVDENENVVPLVAGTEIATPATWSVPLLNTEDATANQAFTFAIDPNAKLEPDRRYRVRAELQEYVQIGGPGGVWRWISLIYTAAYSSERTYYHFTNTAGTDAAWNALARIESVSIARDWRVQTSTTSAFQSFRVVTDTRFLRFDDPGAATPTSHSMAFQFRMSLQDDLGNSQALTEPGPTGHTWSENLATWQGTKEPVNMLRSNLFLYLKPQGQLDPVNRLYSLTLEVWAEPAPGLEPVMITQRSTVPARLLDFNGTLRFGSSFTTTMLSAVATATPPTQNPTYISKEMALHKVSVTAGGATYSGDLGTRTLRLLPSGIATYNDATALTLANEAGATTRSQLSHTGVSYQLGGSLTLDANGARGEILIDPLPAGMGVSQSSTPPTGTDPWGASLLSALPQVAGVYLNASLVPMNAVTWSYPAGVWVMEETKPVAVRSTAITWVPGSGRFDLTTDGQVHHPETIMRQKLAAAPTAIPLKYRERRSNNDAWLLATSVVASPLKPCIHGSSALSFQPGSDATATMVFNLGAGTFKSHFPEATITTTAASGNRINVQLGMVTPDTSFLDGVTVLTEYLRTDPNAPPASYHSVTLIPTGATERMNFTPTGGLRAACGTGGHPLRWGLLDDGRHAFATDPFQQAVFYMPGTFYPQGNLATGGDDRFHQQCPVNIHLVGQVGNSTWNFNQMERPGTTAYNTNSLSADYAGVNLRVASEASGISAQSVICGTTTPPYPLKTACRYYVRRSGVTGIHDALGGPTGVSLFRFETLLTSYGFSFRDSRVTHSVTNGELVVPYPSQFNLPVEDLVFSTDGTPAGGRPVLSGPLTLAYWQTEVTPLGLEFRRTNVNDLAAGVMVIEAAVSLPSLGSGTFLYGSLGFHHQGGLVRAADNIPGLTSRLRAPNQIAFNGPAKPGGYERYRLTPVCDVYLNHHEGGNAGDGFLNLAGMLDVAFFQDIQVHLQASSNSATTEEVAMLHLTGGWTAGTDPNKNSFFNDPDFDPANLGRPSAVTLANYRTGASYRPRAKRTWLDSVKFDYPLVWDNVTRQFTTPDDYTNPVDLMVLSARHQLESLSAEQASLRFGAKYDGIPQISVGNLLVNTLDDATGAISALDNVLNKTVGGALWAASDAAAGLLNESFDKMLGPVVEDALSGGINTAVLNPLAVNGGGGALRPEAQWDENLTALSSTAGWVHTEVTKAGSLPAGVNTRITTEVQASIDEIIAGLDVFIGPGGLLETDSGGNFVFGAAVVFALIDEVASEDVKNLLGIVPGGNAETALAQQTTRALDKYVPALRTARSRLEMIRSRLEEIRSLFNPNQMFARVMAERFDALETEWDDSDPAKLGTVLANDLKQHLRTRYAGNPQAFALPENRAETSAFLIRRIRDRLATAALASHLQSHFRQQFQDVQNAIDQTVGSVFASYKRCIRDLVAEVTSGLDDTLAGLAGDLNGTVQAASVEGHAVIRGDTLNHLRLDATLSLTLDEPMVFKGYLEISQLAANSGYGNAREIRIGATDVPIEIMESTANFDVELRIVLDAASNLPKGLGGKIEMMSGRLTFEGFVITEFGAAVMFGVDENFLAAKLGMEFSSFRVMGGLFIGHSNTPDPLEMVDPEVASMLDPERSITGIYVYGEVYMPIVDLGCFFRVSAGLGLGAFYFTEGPTYGGKIKAAVDGEALCVVSVSGEVVLIGVKTDIIRFKGRGKVKGTIGWCPFCADFKQQVEFTYDKNNGFDANF
jgi:hypothetical protein